MAQNPQGLIYITSEDANIVNLETGIRYGTNLWNIKGPNRLFLPTMPKITDTLISADEQIMAVDANSGIFEFAKTDFDEKENPTSM